MEKRNKLPKEFTSEPHPIGKKYFENPNRKVNVLIYAFFMADAFVALAGVFSYGHI